MSSDSLDKIKAVTSEMIIKKYQTDDVCYDTEGSEISKFYAGKWVLLTGATGFLGKLLVEKLLRACPDIGGIFILVRPKKGKDVHTRIDEIYNSVIYQKLSKLQPKFRHRIVPISGDVALPGLGLSIEDRQTITEKATIFMHCAATVKFHEKLHLAVDINVRGTKEMLILAKECKHIDCFVHVSTVFTHCHRKDIEEKLYDVTYDGEKIMQICNNLPQQMLEKITEDILGDWPNTYVFTKAIAEDYLKKYSSQFPICIVRPAIVIATYNEPIKSWIDNIYGATGIVIGTGVGILRVANINKDMNAEIVPADFVVNCTIAASYKTAVERKTQIPIYNYVSSPQNRMDWKRFDFLNHAYGTKTPTMRCVWICSLALIDSRLWYNICAFLLHTIPALLMDAGLLLIGKKPQMLGVYKKVHNFGDTIQYFGRRNWNFNNDNTQKLFEHLPDADKKLFFFDISKLDWHDYFVTHCLGLREHIVKDDISNIPQARKRYFRLQVAHYLLKIILILIFVRILYALVSYIFF